MEYQFEQVAGKILLERPDFQGVHEEVEWTRVTEEQKALMENTATWDLDYRGFLHFFRVTLPCLG
jgi:hypothetical protein